MSATKSPNGSPMMDSSHKLVPDTPTQQFRILDVIDENEYGNENNDSPDKDGESIHYDSNDSNVME